LQRRVACSPDVSAAPRAPPGERNTYEEAATLMSMAGASGCRRSAQAVQSQPPAYVTAGADARTARCAVDGGVNLFDSAEMYPVPQRAETQARRASA
jgi:hypothetical protein